MDFANKKCGIELEKIKVEKKELELMFAEYQHAWECCEKGGNFTSQGYCSYEWQNKVNISFIQKLALKTAFSATSIMEKPLKNDANGNVRLDWLQYCSSPYANGMGHYQIMQKKC